MIECPADELVVRPAREHELRACRMLTPRLVLMDVEGQYVAAFRGDRIIGAGVLGVRLLSAAAVGSACDVHVIGPERKRGVGRALLRSIEAMAMNMGFRTLFTPDLIDDEKEILAWSAMGFTVAERMLEQRMALEPLIAKLAPLHEEMTQRGWIPETASVVPLNEADLAACAALHVKHLGGDARVILDRFAGRGPHAITPELSFALLLEGEVVALTFGRWDGGAECVVESNVVEPTVRRGWANVMLKLHGARAAQERGVKTFVFHTFDRHTDTRRLNRQVGGEITRARVRMAKPLDGRGAGAGAPSPA